MTNETKTFTETGMKTYPMTPQKIEKLKRYKLKDPKDMDNVPNGEVFMTITGELTDKINELIAFANTLTPMEKPGANTTNPALCDNHVFSENSYHCTKCGSFIAGANTAPPSVTQITPEREAILALAESFEEGSWKGIYNEVVNILNPAVRERSESAAQPTSESGEKKVCCDYGNIGERHYCNMAGEEVNVQPPTEDRSKQTPEQVIQGIVDTYGEDYLRDVGRLLTEDREWKLDIEKLRSLAGPDEDREECKRCGKNIAGTFVHTCFDKSAVNEPSGESSAHNITEVLEAFDKKFGHLQDGERYRTNHQSVKSFLRSSITELLENQKDQIRKQIKGLEGSLWHDDPQEHARRLIRRNITDEVLKLPSLNIKQEPK